MTPAELPEYEDVVLEREGSLTWLTLNRPAKLNAMNANLLAELSAALTFLEGDPRTVVVAIRGAGRAFSAGYDIERDDSRADHGDVDIVDDYVTHARHLERFMQIWDLPKPVIASVHGYCLAGATQLCVFCDITIAADDASIGLPSIPLGGGYITPLWVPLVGPKRAKQMSFVPGSMISGQQASEWGWANYAVPAAGLEDEVRRLAGEIAKIPAPILRMKKLAINRAADLMGFRNIVPLGAETDALLHYSASVKELAGWIQDEGLKGAIARFQSGDLTEDAPGGADEPRATET